MKNQNDMIYGLGVFLCALSKWIKKFRSRKAMLLIKDDGLGDLILWLPYQAELRRHYPAEKWRIDLVVKPEFADFAAKIPGIDHVLTLPAYRNRFQWTFFRLFFYLTHAYDVICNVTVSPHGMWFPFGSVNLVTMLLKDSIFEEAVQYFRNTVYIDGLNIRERYQKVLSHLEISSIPEKMDYTPFYSPTGKISGSYIVICPGAGDSRRCWEAGKYIQLTDRLLSEWHGCAILAGTASERQLCESIRKSCKNPDRIRNLSGELTVPELFTLIRQSAFLLSNDTGTCHIGAALGVKTFIICGQGDYGSFVPYPETVEWKHVHCIFAKKHQCRCRLWQNDECRKRKTYPCIAEISVDDVWEIIRKYAMPNGEN